MWRSVVEDLPGIHRALPGFHPHDGGNESTKICELSSTCGEAAFEADDRA